MNRLLAPLIAALLATAPAAASAPSAPDLSSIDATMQRIVRQHGLDGASLWVSDDGRTVFTGHYGGYGPETRVAIASASKWVSALVLARLVERGTLRWTSTVGEWFPGAPADKRAITLAQLFSHTSGLPGAESGCIANPLTTLQACSAQILSGPMIAAPGTTFAYGGLSMQVAGAMAERATGKPWATLFDEELRRPLGLTGTDFGVGSTAPGTVMPPNPRIAGGVRSTLDDYRRLMAMWEAEGVIPDGPHAGQAYLSTRTVRAMQRDLAAGTAKVDVPPVPRGLPSWGYGFGFWILPTARDGALFVDTSPGAFGFQGWVDREAGIAGVFMVKDANIRMAPEVAALQAELVGLLEPTRASVPGQAPVPRSGRRGLARSEFVEGP